MLARTAAAQDLVSNPNFTNGFTGYTTTGSTVLEQFSDAAGDRFQTGVLIEPATISQTIATTPGVRYDISFLANFFSPPGSYDVSFGNGNLPLNPTASNLTLTPFGFSMTATSTSTTLEFVANSGVFGVTDLNVQAGPAPTLGGGAVSLVVCLAGMIAHRARRSAFLRR